MILRAGQVVLNVRLGVIVVNIEFVIDVDCSFVREGITPLVTVLVDSVPVRATLREGIKPLVIVLVDSVPVRARVIVVEYETNCDLLYDVEIEAELIVDNVEVKV